MKRESGSRPGSRAAPRHWARATAPRTGGGSARRSSAILDQRRHPIRWAWTVARSRGCMWSREISMTESRIPPPKASRSQPTVAPTRRDLRGRLWHAGRTPASEARAMRFGRERTPHHSGNERHANRRGALGAGMGGLGGCRPSAGRAIASPGAAFTSRVSRSFGIQSPRDPSPVVRPVPTDHLHVLLRHRPRSIPQAQESA